MRNQLAVRLNDNNQYEVIGKRVRGTFRGALREYGLTKSEIDRVIADIDCDRDVAVTQRGHTHHFRAL